MRSGHVQKIEDILTALLNELGLENKSGAMGDLLYLIKKVQEIEAEISAQQLAIRLRQVAKEEPGSPPLIALVLSQRGLGPLRKESPKPGLWWKEMDRLAEDVRGFYDKETGLPLFVERAKDEAVMALVPAGEFIFGCDKSEWEKPKRTEKTGYFYIDRLPVPLWAFKRFLKASQIDYEKPSIGRWDHQAANFVSLENARAYAAWAGASIPNELQWEKAARGTDGRTYPWGEEPLAWKYANYFYNEGQGDRYAFLDCHIDGGGNHPAGQSPFGVHDLLGNVWEWCSNPFDGTRPQEALYPIRGGSCIEWGTGLRCAYRNVAHAKPATFRDQYLGFRLVVQLEEL